MTRLHAINWYGYQDTIDVMGNVLVTGVSGSGKSILMDLIQAVLVGTQKARFNQSATGERSDRNLKGYCLGDTKLEDNQKLQYMRSTGITYIALEFTWPDGKKQETWGLRIEFSHAGQEKAEILPFFYPDRLNLRDFLDEDHKPVSEAVFKNRLKSEAGEAFSSQEKYRNEMATVDHLNFDRMTMDKTLPTAMSFTFMDNFNRFCRDHILPNQVVDVDSVVTNYRAFKQYTEELEKMRLQTDHLRLICDYHAKWIQSGVDSVLYEYLGDEAEFHYRQDEFHTSQREVNGLLEEFNEARLKQDNLRNRRDDLKKEFQTLQDNKAGLKDAGLYDELKRQIKGVTEKLVVFREYGQSVKGAARARGRLTREWMVEYESLARQHSSLNLGYDLNCATILETESSFDSIESACRDAAKIVFSAHAHLSEMALPLNSKIRELQEERKNLQEQLARLESGRVEFTTPLLDRLNTELPSHGGRPAAVSLAQLCEVTDEKWRPALEVAFTQKFAVVVGPENFPKAAQIYHRLAQINPRESLINPEKALKGMRSVQPGSLAEKITSDHPVVRAILASLFGHVMCIDRIEDISKHERAIMPDGFGGRGAFLHRSEHYNGRPYIGADALQRLSEEKRKEMVDISGRLAVLQPQLDDLNNLRDRAIRQKLTAETLHENIGLARNIPELEKELNSLIARLAELDRTELDALQEKIQRKNEELTAVQNELESLLGLGLDHRVSTAQNLLASAEEDRNRAQNRYEATKGRYIGQVSEHIGRMQELQKEVYDAFPFHRHAAEDFRHRKVEAEKEIELAKTNMMSERRLLAVTYPEFSAYDPEKEDNSEYQRRLDRINQAEIPDYQTKANSAHEAWESSFQSQIVEKMRIQLEEVENYLDSLNSQLRDPIGTNKYRFHLKKNPEFEVYHRMIEIIDSAKEGDLWYESASSDIVEARKHLLETLVSDPHGAEAIRLLDYRYYYDYDMMITDLTQPDAKAYSYNRQAGKASGGENQSPFFVAIVAAYLRVYKRHLNRKTPTLGLIPIDEAFSKLSGERISDCIQTLQNRNLQGFLSMTTGNIPYAFEKCDWLIAVRKENRQNKGRMMIRNIPWSASKLDPEAQDAIGTAGDEE